MTSSRSKDVVLLALTGYLAGHHGLQLLTLVVRRRKEVLYLRVHGELGLGRGLDRRGLNGLWKQVLFVSLLF